VVEAKVVAANIPLHQPVRRVADRQRVGRSEALQPGCEVGRLSQSQLLVSATVPHRAHNHQPGMDADPDGEARALGLF
jgi:hypothetical protein